MLVEYSLNIGGSGACAGKCDYGPQCERPCPSGCQHHLPKPHPTTASPFSTTKVPQDDPVFSTTSAPSPLERFLKTKVSYPKTTTYPPIPPYPTSVRPCHPDTGACLSGCVKGRYGSLCQHSCSSNCSEQDCLQSGECVSGCRRGSYGDTCNTPCSSSCIYQECHQNGTCALGCIDGFYGHSCDARCGKNCLHHGCRQNSSTGTFVCKDGCVAGWRGRMCQHRCPVHCLSCHPDIERGSCSSCEQGWSGINCKIPIINHCKAPIEGEKCTSGCSDGFCGLTCQLKCPDFCLRCEQEGNECTLCHPGRFGSRCDKFCKDCQQGLCRTDTGECIHGSRQQEDYVCHQHAYMLDFNSTHCARHHREKRHIVQCTDHCQSSSCSVCDLGWFGERCTKFCPQNCFDGCNKTGACNGCHPNYYGDKCELKCPQNCRESSPGEVVCDEQRGHCLAGCKTGWYGDSCNVICPQNCKRNICNQYNGKCTNGCNLGWKWNSHLKRCLQESFTFLRNVKPKHQPLSCRNQMYGEGCEINCSTSCINSSCEISSERKSPVCSFGCVDGYHGQYCENRCPAGCQSCSDKSVCTSCKPGLYGQTCSDTCSSNCKGCWCFKNGSCAKGCIEGYHGQVCETKCEANCQNCDQTSGKCLSCKPGWCGGNCDVFCGGCKLGICAADGQCPLGCNPGYAGPMCNDSLYENEQPCAKFRNEHTRMKRHACQYGCMTSECATCLDGFYGDLCKKNCPTNCDSTCNKTSGQCDHSCRKNWGPFCEDECPVNCLEGCDMLSGQCYGGCSEGWYGLKCDQTCPKECFSDICYQDSGKCVQGCTKGWQGDLCNMPCSDGCLNGSCFQNGTCELGCYSNYTGLFGKCSVSCIENCAGNICHISKPLRSYVCTQGCKDGFAGASCSEKCSGSCKTCEQYDALKCKVCSCSMYGSECQNHCSETCNNSTCPVCDNKGSCRHGCVDGTWGKQCQERCSSNCIACDGKEKCTRCKNGLYGKRCSEKCSRCQGGDCHQNGTCINGCVHGLKGPKCNIVTNVPEWTGREAVFTVIVVGGTIIYYVFLWRQAAPAN
ncbi:multiple epidermal growth factor-like domains protein 6 [Haliotis rubra]|uniref:multiple epidermal growth factor-like domains protein 6 n=1 Tax=Haliotis rubra TaxID=36100 RepID=UPI001EE54854|nr:multiple epidermal growth factor-like domains protein 6 [Haliotis rubra]